MYLIVFADKKRRKKLEKPQADRREQGAVNTENFRKLSATTFIFPKALFELIIRR